MQSQDNCMLKEIESLSRKYDALLASKRKAEQKYKEDYRKWRSFKKWLMSKSTHPSSLRSRIQEDASLQLGIMMDNGQKVLSMCPTGDSDEEGKLLQLRSHYSQPNSLVLEIFGSEGPFKSNQKRSYAKHAL